MTLSTAPAPTSAPALPLARVLVGGRTVDRPTLEVVDPAHPARVVGRCALGTAEDVEAAVQAACAAAPVWAAMSPTQRAELLVAAADRLDESVPERAALLVREIGKVPGEARVDAAGAGSLLRYFASLAAQLELEPDLGMTLPGTAHLRRLPIGPIGVISPWNTPVYLTFMALGPALLAGNPVVVKPPEIAPLALSATLEVLAEVLPAGVVGMVPGLGADAGAALAGHPGIRKVMFTGSVPTGKEVLRAAADNVASVSLELGGNDPAVLLDDVLIDDALVTELIAGVFALSGQVCYDVKRIYVHRSRIAEFLDAFCAAVDRITVGDPTDPDTTIGPVTTEAGRDRLAALVEGARADGATVRTLGRVGVQEDGGWYVMPTVVSDLPPDSPLVVQEQFGPVIPVLPFDDDEEAVALANSTEFGLAASVWSADRERARALARRLEAGTVFINVHRVGASPMSVPFGGVKHSGLGRSHGLDSVLACTEPQAVVEFDDPAELPGLAHWQQTSEERQR